MLEGLRRLLLDQKLDRYVSFLGCRLHIRLEPKAFLGALDAIETRLNEGNLETAEWLIDEARREWGEDVELVSALARVNSYRALADCVAVDSQKAHAAARLFYALSEEQGSNESLTTIYARQVLRTIGANPDEATNEDALALSDMLDLSGEETDMCRKWLRANMMSPQELELDRCAKHPDQPENCEECFWEEDNNERA
jgi:hypothetical protein